MKQNINKEPFFKTLPGILTGIAAVIAALSTLYISLRNDTVKPSPVTSDTASKATVPTLKANIQQNEGDSNINQQVNGNGNMTIGKSGNVSVVKENSQKDSSNGKAKKEP